MLQWTWELSVLLRMFDVAMACAGMAFDALLPLSDLFDICCRLCISYDVDKTKVASYVE